MCLDFMSIVISVMSKLKITVIDFVQWRLTVMADKIITFSVYSYMDVLAETGANMRPVGEMLCISTNSFNKFVKYLQVRRPVNNHMKYHWVQ